MEETTPAPAPAAPAPSSPAPKSGPMNHDIWQWVVIIGTITFFSISLYSMYHQVKLNKLQIADIVKKQNGIPTA